MKNALKHEIFKEGPNPGTQKTTHLTPGIHINIQTDRKKETAEVVAYSQGEY